jgi:putative ABC transport system substrate-binding protein
LNIGNMDRRAFITIGGMATLAVVTRAQPRSRRVACLLTVDSAAGRSSLAVFQQRLDELGWTHGRNIQIDPYWAGVDGDRTRAYVTQLVRTNPDVILSTGTISMAALVEQKITAIPIVFVQVTDPVAAGFVKSLTRPGANITGFTNFSSTVGAARLRLLRDIAPTLERVMMVFDAGYPTPPGLIRSTQDEAAALGIELHAAGMRDVTQLEQNVREFGKRSNGGLVVLADPFTGAQVERIIRLADRYRLAAVYALASFAEAGGLTSYGVNVPDMWRAAASYVDRILRGDKPEDLPVQEPTEPEIVVNLKTAKALGLTPSNALLSRASRVIQ